jgi:hypothetical protein
MLPDQIARGIGLFSTRSAQLETGEFALCASG